MKTEHTGFEKAKSGRSPRRIIIWAAAVVAAAAAAVILLAPVYISSESGRRFILEKINSAVDGTARIESINMSWRKGIEAAGIGFTGADGNVAFAAKTIRARPHYASLLTGSLSLGKTVIEKPSLELTVASEGRTRPPAGSDRRPAPSRPPALPVSRADLFVKDGSVKVTGPDSQAVTLERINSELRLRPPGHRSSFEVAMSVAAKEGESQMRASGNLRPAKRTPWRLETTSGDLAVEVNDLDIASLGPFFSLAGVEASATGKVSASLRGAVAGGGVERLEGTLNAENLDIAGPALKGNRFSTSRLDTEVKLHRTAGFVNINKLDVRGDWFEARATGAVPATARSLGDFLEADSRQDLTADVRCDLAKAFAQIPGVFRLRQDMQVTSGALTFNISTQMANGKRRISGRAMVDGLNGSVGSTPMQFTAPVTLAAEVSSTAAGVNFDRLDLESAFGRVNCSGRPESLDVDADLDLAKLQSQVGQFVDFKQTQMAGSLASKGTASLDWEKGLYRYFTNDTTVRGFVFSHPGGQPFEAATGSILLEAEISTETNTISIKQFKVDTPNIEIRKGQFEKTDAGGTTNLKGHMDCRYRWQSVISLARPYLPPHFELAGGRNQSLNFASTYPVERPEQLVPNLIAKTTIGFDSAGYMGLKFGPTDTDLIIEKGMLNIKPFTSAVNDGRINFGGSVDLTSDPPILRISKPMQIAEGVRLTEETAGTLLPYLNPIFWIARRGGVGTSGLADFDCERLAIPLGKAHRQEIVVAGTISISRMRMNSSGLLEIITKAAGMSFQEQQIDIEPTKFALENGLLSYEKMSVLVGGKPYIFNGVIGLDKSLDMTVTLPYGGGESAGAGTTLAIKGTIDKPEINIGDLLRRQLEDRLRQGIREGLDKLLR